MWDPLNHTAGGDSGAVATSESKTKEFITEGVTKLSNAFYRGYEPMIRTNDKATN